MDFVGDVESGAAGSLKQFGIELSINVVLVSRISIGM